MISLFTLAQFVNIPGSFFNRHTNAAVVGNNVGSLVSRLLPNIIVVAGVVFFLMIIYYGFQLIISAGQNKSPQDIARIKVLPTPSSASCLSSPAILYSR